MEKWQEKLAALREANNRAAWAMSEYIDETPAAITQALVKSADTDGHLPEEALYAAFMAGFSGVPEKDHITSAYFMDAVKRLEISDYQSDPYIASIRFPDVASHHWRFTHYCYKPYEAFIRDDISIEPGLREVPQVGYFTERFMYPAVEQDGREWMAVKPSEIETMRQPLDIVSGRVVTFGLGLGYFTFMASRKSEVETVDVVERDAEVIELFSRYILPQFPDKGKIRIIHDDAFAFMRKQMLDQGYDYAFVDLWHDTSDGLELYLKSKDEENRLRRDGATTEFLYWVERSLLSAYRWTKFDEILSACGSEEEALEALSDDSLRSMLSD